MKKIFLVGVMVALVSAGAYAAEGDYERAVATCEELGGVNYESTDAFSGEVEVSCRFAPAVSCGQLQLLENTCVVNESEVEVRNLCSALKGTVSEEGSGLVSCEFGEFGVCTRAELLAGDCSINGQYGASRFNDINGYLYEAAIRYVEVEGIVVGYEDGSYRPEAFINRAEFTKIVVEALYNSENYAQFAGTNCFPDVALNQWFTPYICFAKNLGIVGGNPDGTFKPGDLINYAEAMKIVLEAYGKSLTPAGGPWFNKYLFFGVLNNLSLALELDPGSMLTRGQMAELIYWVSHL